MTDDGDLAVARVGDAVVVRVAGELDLATAPALWAALERALIDAHQVVVDLSAVTFVDSTGLSVLLRAYQAVGVTGTLKVRGPNAQARRLFEMSRVESLIDVES